MLITKRLIQYRTDRQENFSDIFVFLMVYLNKRSHQQVRLSSWRVKNKDGVMILNHRAFGIFTKSTGLK